MKTIKLLGFIALSVITFSCSTEQAEKVADEFHQKLDERDYDYIVNNLADLEDVTKDEWHGFLSIVDGWGPQTNRVKESGFNKKIDNGIERVRLSYTFDIPEIGKVYERIVLVERPEGYKIRTVLMNSDESIVIKGTEEF